MRPSRAGLDLTIRARFPGKSHDDWMHAMWREHPDVDRPYTSDDLERTLGETTGDMAFAHDIFTRFYQRHRSDGLPEPAGTSRLYAPAFLARARLVRRAPHSSDGRAASKSRGRFCGIHPPTRPASTVATRSWPSTASP